MMREGGETLLDEDRESRSNDEGKGRHPGVGRKRCLRTNDACCTRGGPPKVVSGEELQVVTNGIATMRRR